MSAKSFEYRTQKEAKRVFWLVLALLAILHAFARPVQAKAGEFLSEQDSGLAVQAQAANGSTILFKTQNGRTINGVTPETKEIPHLVLFRNGELTGAGERTLDIEISGIPATAPGMEITLTVETQQGDPDRGGGEEDRLTVWQSTYRISQAGDASQAGLNAFFRLEFSDEMTIDGEWVRTPTGYFRYEVEVDGASNSEAEPLVIYEQDYAFLMESQWVSPLNDLLEDQEGAAPDELVIYYSDMFSFQKDPYDPDSRLPRQQVPEYIRSELAPGMVKAVRTQTNEWDFPWNEAWTSYRGGADAERLSVALAKGGTWYHGQAPTHANAGISINLEGEDRVAYDTLTDWILSVFHHELFHNMQRNLNQASGQAGGIAGEQGVWEFLTEGTASLASSVGQPEIELGAMAEARSYLSKANHFLAGDHFTGDSLNTSYREINPYQMAIYWRFLYEAASGLNSGNEQPAAGMGLIRHVFAALYAHEEWLELSPEELVVTWPKLMDEAFSQTHGSPFKTYLESLVEFAGAVYGLALDDGNRTALDEANHFGFSDPHRHYAAPQVRTIGFSEKDQQYTGEIGSSFGIDFVEVSLEAAAQSSAIALEFSQESPQAVFHVQVWGISGSSTAARTPVEVASIDFSNNREETGLPGFELPAINIAEFDRLGLVITRLDSQETDDPAGAYWLSLRAAGDSRQE